MDVLYDVDPLEVNYHLTTLLNTKTDTVGQKRVNAGKKFVVYKPSHEGVVYKGPYTKKTPAYQAILKRDVFLRERNVKHILYPVGIARCDNTVNKDGKECLAIVFPDLMNGLRQFSEESEEYVEKDGLRYNVRGNNPYFMKLSQYLEKTKEFEILNNYELLRAYVLLFILETGDVGLHNTIVTIRDGNAGVYIIDYEDNRVEQRDDATFYFNKPSAPKYRVYEHFSRYYKRLAAELELSTFSGKYADRAQNAIYYLEKYATNALSATPTSKAKGTPESKKEQTTPKGKKEQTKKKGKESEKSQVTLLEEEDSTGEKCQFGIGQLYTCGSMRGNNKTFHGYKPGVIKSALQKNVRRGFTEQAIASAFELWQFQIVDATYLVNNMYNRLRIIACEDVSPKSLQIQAYVCRWVEKWTHDGEQPFKTPIKDPVTRIDISGTSVLARYNPARLAGIVHALSEFPKSRIASHLFNAYTRDPGVKALRSHGFEVDKIIVTQQDMDDVHLLKLPFLSKEDMMVDDGNMAALICIIYKRLNAKDPNAVRWITYFLEKYKKTKVTGRKRKNAVILLWEVYGLFIIKEILEPIRDSYYNASEKRPIWMCVACNILVGVRDASFDEHVFDPYVEAYNNGNVLKDYVNARYTLRILDYMLDKHTGKKGDALELQKQFVLEGAQVNNQDPTTFSPVLKTIYEKLPPAALDKKNKDNGEGVDYEDGNDDDE